MSVGPHNIPSPPSLGSRTHIPTHEVHGGTASAEMAIHCALDDTHQQTARSIGKPIVLTGVDLAAGWVLAAHSSLRHEHDNGHDGH